jgi:DNA-directed RNA polymerase specialized sigma24 family protein
MGQADRTTSELTSEVFAAAFEASARYRRNGTPARAWLFGIADHKLADAARRRHIDDRAQRRLGIERLELPDQELERVEISSGRAGAWRRWSTTFRRPSARRCWHAWCAPAAIPRGPCPRVETVVEDLPPVQLSPRRRTVPASLTCISAAGGRCRGEVRLLIDERRRRDDSAIVARMP